MSRADRFRKLEREDFDVIVIGAGIGGLTAAALLAKHGQNVLIVDQHYVPGGNATVFKRRGYEFDVGLHYIGDADDRGLFPRVLAAAGAEPVTFRPMDPDAFDTVVLPGLELGVPRGIERYRLRLVDAFPEERRGIDRYVRYLTEQLEVARAAPRPRRLARALLGSRLLIRWANGTLGAFLDTCTRDPALRTVLAAESGDYAEPPSRASLTLHAGLMLHYLEKGGFYPEGGGQIMSDHLAASIERHGGKVLLSTRVERILVQNGRATGVRLSNKHIGRRDVRARRVISNADIKRLYFDLLGPEVVRARTLSRARRWQMAPALGVVYLGVRREGLGQRLRNTNYWIYPHDDIERAYSDVRFGRFSDQPLAYVSLASLKDPENPRLAPHGMANLQIMSLAPSDPGAWGVTEAEQASGRYGESAVYQERKLRYADQLLGVAERVFPGLREHVVFQEVATPLTHSRYTLSSGGTSYGLALIPEQFLWKRPGPKTEIEHLFVCGASTYTGHGIAGAMLSGVNAASAVLGRSAWGEATDETKRRVVGGAVPGDAQPSTRSPAATTVRTGFQPNA